MAQKGLDPDLTALFRRMEQGLEENLPPAPNPEPPNPPPPNPDPPEDDDGTLPDLVIPPEMLADAMVRTANRPKDRKKIKRLQDKKRKIVSWDGDKKTEAKERRANNESYKEIGEALGVPKSTIIRWCQGKGEAKLGRKRLLKEKEEDSLAEYLKYRSRHFQGLKIRKAISSEVSHLLQDSERAKTMKEGGPSEYNFS